MYYTMVVLHSVVSRYIKETKKRNNIRTPHVFIVRKKLKTLTKNNVHHNNW